jgi:hypothetical protein
VDSAAFYRLLRLGEGERSRPIILYGVRRMVCFMCHTLRLPVTLPSRHALVFPLQIISKHSQTIFFLHEKSQRFTPIYNDINGRFLHFRLCLFIWQKERSHIMNVTVRSFPRIHSTLDFHVNLLKSTSYWMHQQFNIQQLYALPTPYLCVLYLSENKQRLLPYITSVDWFL